MSKDPNDPLGGLDDLDWESALDEWETKSFTADAPKEKESAPNLGAAPKDAPADPGPPSDPALKARPDGTLIAQVPRELRDDPGPAAARLSSAPSSPPARGPSSAPPRISAPPVAAPQRISAPPTSRGGLNQLFSRPPTQPGADRPSARPQPPAPTPSSEKTRVAVAAPKREFPSVTKQIAVPETARFSEAESPTRKHESDETVVGRMADVPPSVAPSTSRDPDAPSSDRPSERDTSSVDVADIATQTFARALSGDEVDAPEPLFRPARPPFESESETETFVRDRHDLDDADTATRHPADEPAPARAEQPASIPTLQRAPVVSQPAFREPSAPPEAPEAEQAGSQWLDGDKARAFASRIEWLEEEARCATDPTARARALLAVSELCALSGDAERGRALATEARDLAPHLALAWRQARQLLPADPDVVVEALDAEAAHSPTPSARAHSVLLAADILRTGGSGDAGVERWDRACKLDPSDVRGPIARAALALAQHDHTSPSLRLAENSEMVALDKAVATALRLRGIERAGAEANDVTINDGLRRARQALGAGDVVGASNAVSDIASVPGLSSAALWASAALGSAHIASRRAAARALRTLVGEGDSLARRQLAARGLELGDPELVAVARADGGSAFEPAERAVLSVLATKEHVVPDVAELALDDGMAALVDALTSLEPRAGGDEAALARANHVAGDDVSRPLATLGRLLASSAAASDVDGAFASIDVVRSAAASGVAIESAVRGRRWEEVSDALAALPSNGASQQHVAAALVAERAGSRERAKTSWSEAARGEGLTNDGLLRIAADLDPDFDLAGELLRLADGMPENATSAVIRLEAFARSRGLSADAQIGILEQVHRSAPVLGIGGFLAERAGRRKGDLDEVLRWIQERRAHANDPFESALDAVREALLVADRDPELASSRLEEAHRARPDDVALRELYERLATEPPTDRAAWREARAAKSEGSKAIPLWIEAALEHERSGDAAAALRATRKAVEAGDRGLAGPIAERVEILTGETTARTERLIEITKSTEDARARRDALEQLAEIDLYGKKDTAAALLWQRAILEDVPRHLPSLRWVEHALISEGRDDELWPIFEQIAIALDGSRGGETSAHAQHAARLRARGETEVATAWEQTHDMVRLAATQPEPSLWSLRALNAHARVRKEQATLLTTSLTLLDRTQRPAERAALLLRASEAAARLEKVAEARSHLEQAANEDPGDVVTWGLLADLRQQVGEARESAEACESLARTSVVRDHQLLAWHDASKIWLDEVKDTERGMSALEAAAEIDVTYADVFPRLSALYAESRLDAELARLLERRLESVDDEGERVALEVELSRALADMGDIFRAKTRLESALKKRPDHTTALAAFADLCVKEADWAGAEQALVRLARLLSDPAEQRAIYERLGEIYSVHAPNLSRAEIALREVLKRSPNDVKVLGRLVEIYKRQGDVQKSVEIQQEMIAAETDPNARLAGLIELARIHETVGRDPRRSEQVLDAARKEFPTSVVALRALAEFYSRQRQMPAMQILLDRAAGDARRAFAQGRFVPSLFQVLHAAFELRGKRDAARVVAATLAAVEGQTADLAGADAAALDPRFDDLLAPELTSGALRNLLFRTGDALDAVTPVDLRVLKATPLQPGTVIGEAVGSVATVVGLGAMHVYVSPVLGRVALPLATNPPALLVGEALGKVKNDRARMFVIARAMKMIIARGSALLRAQPAEVEGLVAGLFNAFNPTYVPQGMDPKRVNELSHRIGPALPRNLDPTVGVIALEAAGMIGSQWSNLGHAIHGWANRVALLAVGDPNAALDAIAWGLDEDAAPTGSEERAAWIARHRDARDLMTFSVTDAFAEARIQLGLDR